MHLVSIGPVMLNLVYILIRGPPIVCTWFSATRGRDMVLHPLIGGVHLVSIGPSDAEIWYIY